MKKTVKTNNFKWNGLIIDWMTGDHLQFDTFKEAKKEYGIMLKTAKKNKEEIDLQLLEVKAEFCNIKY